MSKKIRSRASSSRGNLGLSSRGAVRLANQRKTTGISPYHYATLVYPVAFTSSSATGGAWYWQFRLNSLFDPDFTGGGTQPTTFDQWMALYDRYRVLACTVDLTLSDATWNNPAVSFAPSVDSTPTLTYAGIGGMRDAAFGAILPQGAAHVKRTYLMKDVFGLDEEAMMSELNLSGSSGTSAASVAYGTIASFHYSSTPAVTLFGSLRFAVRFESPHANNVSLARAQPSLVLAREVVLTAREAARSSIDVRFPQRDDQAPRARQSAEAVLNDDYSAVPLRERAPKRAV